MKAAIVVEAGRAPIYGDFKDPVPANGEIQVTVSAAALSNVVRSRASGTHYSSSGELPFVVGIDGVGHLDDGRRVYFVLPRAPFGSMAEKTVIRPSQCVSLPDNLDDVTAAAIANPGMSAWAAFTERAKLKTGETVLINGGTGTAGRLAVQIANIGVAHVARSLKWYQSLFGQRGRTPAHDYWAQVLDADGTVLLCLHQWGTHEHPPLNSADRAPPGNGLLLFFRVDDFDDALSRARSLVGSFEQEVQVNPATGTREFALRDLDGYYLMVSALA